MNFDQMLKEAYKYKDKIGLFGIHSIRVAAIDMRKSTGDPWKLCLEKAYQEYLAEKG